MSEKREYKFDSFLPVGTNGNYGPVYTSGAINGVLLSVSYTMTPVITGSILLAVSGVSSELLCAIKGNLNTVVPVFPVVYPVDSMNVTGSPQIRFNRVVNDVLMLSVSGIASLGAPKTVSGITIYYE